MRIACLGYVCATLASRRLVGGSSLGLGRWQIFILQGAERAHELTRRRVKQKYKLETMGCMVVIVQRVTMASCSFAAPQARATAKRAVAPCLTSKRALRAARLVMHAAMVDAPVPMLGDKMRPDPQGRFGSFGGKYVPETLMPALLELDEEYNKARKDPEFLVRATLSIGVLAA